MNYIPIGNNLYLSPVTGLIHECRSGEQIFELLRLMRPFEMEEKTEKRAAVGRAEREGK